jgi:hypothetical protein
MQNLRTRIRYHQLARAQHLTVTPTEWSHPLLDNIRGAEGIEVIGTTTLRNKNPYGEGGRHERVFQWPAEAGPGAYGPKSPSFARTTYLRQVGRHARSVVSVSGTASVIGDNTAHPGYRGAV